jgi:hypothetical protein
MAGNRRQYGGLAMTLLQWIEHDGSDMDISVTHKEILCVATDKGKVVFWTASAYGLKWSAVVAYCVVKVSDILPPYEKKRWRAKRGGQYWFVTIFGDLNSTCDYGFESDLGLFRAHNYFRTAEEAKASKIYQAFERE